MYTYTYKSDHIGVTILNYNGVYDEERTEVFTFRLDVRMANDRKVNPVLTSMALDTLAEKLSNTEVDKHLALGQLHNHVREKVEYWLSRYGSVHFPGKKKIEYAVATKIPGRRTNNEMSMPWEKMELK